MHGIYHEVIAALGGILFIIIGITRQQERLRVARTGKQAESNVLWTSLIIAGTCLLIFAVGLLLYQMNHNAH
jgi:hypothetical protein